MKYLRVLPPGLATGLSPGLSPGLAPDLSPGLSPGLSTRLAPRLVPAVLLGVLLVCSKVASAQDVILDEIRAVVNNGVVLASDIQSALLFVKQQARSNQQTLPPDNVLSERVLQDLVDREIRRQHAADLGIAIDPSSVNRAIEQIARNNNMDTLQFRETLNKQGFNYDLFRNNIEQELLLQRLVERDVQTRIRVSAQEIDDYVDAIKNDAAEQQRYRLQHILIAVPQSADEAELAQAEQRVAAVLARLNNGDDFAEVAAASSDGARALQGGDLGWRSKQEVPEFLVAALSDLEVGAITAPLRSVNGLHIIKLNDRQTGDQREQAETLARHIFIAGDDAAIATQLAALRTRIVGGAAFAAVASAASEDPNSAPNGGELPWFSAGQMPAAMEEVANSLAIGVVSQPFRTQFGWHLLEVLERRVRAVDDDALRQRAEAALRQRKIEQETQRWQQQLRDESFVDVRS